jgi:hypothetical protein
MTSLKTSLGASSQDVLRPKTRTVKREVPFFFTRAS